MIRSGQVAKWNTAWILADVRRLAKPIRYDHPSGAVTWVNLADDVSRAKRSWRASVGRAASASCPTTIKSHQTYMNLTDDVIADLFLGLVKRAHARGAAAPHWVKSKNPAAAAVKREAEEDWGRDRWR
jgi:hypothetical protein